LAQVRSETRSSNNSIPLAGHLVRGLREGALIVFVAIAIFLVAALVTYHPADPGWSHSTTADKIANVGGKAGAWFADFSLYLFGFLAYLFPVLIAYSGWLLFKARTESGGIDFRQLIIRFIGFILTLCAGAGLATLHMHDVVVPLPLDSGGILGDVVGNNLVLVFSFLGTTLLLLALFLTGITFFTSLSWFRLMDKTGRFTLAFFAWLRGLGYGAVGSLQESREGRKARALREQIVKEDKKKKEKREPVRIDSMFKKSVKSDRYDRDRQSQLFEPLSAEGLPPLTLLDAAEPSGNEVSDAVLEATSRLVEIKLKEFNVTAEVVAVHPGPVITRYELQLSPGVKISQISNLAKDLARSMAVISVRVVEVIPGKPTIGLEVPNEYREIVRLSQILSTNEYDSSRSPLTLALGNDISGQPIVADLAKMPHLLVAGTTGSGKSVAINAMILSLLFKSTPQDVRMIMIDPKMLELSVYEGIPHLLTPVVTDMKEAANALRWCVAEMDRRYKLMASLGVRNLLGYNKKVKDAIKSDNPIPDPTFKPTEFDMEPRYLAPLPSIVVIVDELADMMMLVGKKVEQLIARLAQKARASGIHLLLATQRPSVDVLTGLIKANVPTRIAFQVSSKIDSRTILDQSGAEQLLGHGDMLYLPPGTAVPTRVHGAFVDDHEVHKVVASLVQDSEPDYLDEILTGPDPADAAAAGGFLADEESESDPLYDQAVYLVTETRRASISSVQRRLKVGYNRAARMIEEMEAAGVVSPQQSNGNREVLAPPPR